MDQARPLDSMLAQARDRASSGAWDDVRALLAARGVEARAHPELITMLGEAYLRTRAPREARAWLEETESALRRSGDRAAMRKGANLLGVARFELGALDDATQAFGRAVELGRSDGDDLVVARATNNLGMIANIHGAHAEALALYRMSIPAYQRLGNARGLAETHHNLAITFRDLRDWQSAEEHERRALEYARQAADARTEAIALSGLADLQLQWGDAPLAEATAGFAAREFARLGDAKGEADSLRLVGVAALAQRKDVAAREALARAVALASERGFALIEAEARRARAELALASNDVPSARTESERALAIFERLAAAAEAESLRQWIGSLPR